jgi:DNA-binding transcriptional ArsR family regulator
MNMQTFRALSENTRLDIVKLLIEKPMSVSEIVHILHVGQPQVSKQLKILRIAGLVEVYPKAQQRIYQLISKPFREIDMWLNSYRKLWEERFNRLDTVLADEKNIYNKKLNRKEVK